MKGKLVKGYRTKTTKLGFIMETLYAVNNELVCFELPERREASDFPKTGWKLAPGGTLPAGTEYIGEYVVIGV